MLFVEYGLTLVKGGAEIVGCEGDCGGGSVLGPCSSGGNKFGEGKNGLQQQSWMGVVGYSVLCVGGWQKRRRSSNLSIGGMNGVCGSTVRA